jgi:hypothetical protein
MFTGHHEFMINRKCFYCGEETPGWGKAETPSEHLRRLDAENQPQHNRLCGTGHTQSDRS